MTTDLVVEGVLAHGIDRERSDDLALDRERYDHRVAMTDLMGPLAELLAVRVIPIRDLDLSGPDRTPRGALSAVGVSSHRGRLSSRKSPMVPPCAGMRTEPSASLTPNQTSPNPIDLGEAAADVAHDRIDVLPVEDLQVDLVEELGAGLLPLVGRDVILDRQEVGDPTLGVANAADRGRLPVELTALLAVAQLTLPLLALGDGLPELAVELGRVDARLEDAGVSARSPRRA